MQSVFLPYNILQNLTSCLSMAPENTSKTRDFQIFLEGTERQSAKLHIHSKYWQTRNRNTLHLDLLRSVEDHVEFATICNRNENMNITTKKLI